MNWRSRGADQIRPSAAGAEINSDDIAQVQKALRAGDVPGQDRGERPDGGGFAAAAASLHAGPDRVRAEAGAEATSPEGDRLCRDTIKTFPIGLVARRLAPTPRKRRHLFYQNRPRGFCPSNTGRA